MITPVESFIEHQDACAIRRVQPDHLQVMQQQKQQQQQACSSRTVSSASPSSENNNSLSIMSKLLRSFPLPTPQVQQLQPDHDHMRNIPTHHDHGHQPRQNLELQLLPLSSNTTTCQVSNPRTDNENHVIDLNISIGNNDIGGSDSALRTEEQLKVLKMEQAFAEEARKQAKRQIELAEKEFANAKRIRQQAQAELERAQFLKEQATKKISSTMLEITCHVCKQKFHATKTTGGAMYSTIADETSLGMSYMSNSAITEGEGE